MSAGPGNGANLGGLAGADRHCQMLAEAQDAGNRTRRAYLSTQGQGAVTVPECPNSGTVTGVRMASDVVGPSGQGIAAGEFAEVLRAIRSGNAYINVHSTTWPGGEIRGQIRTNNRRDRR